MICPFEECQRMTTLPMESATHLIVAIDDNDRAHIHGPIEPEDVLLMERMLMEVARYCHIDLRELAKKLDQVEPMPRKVSLQ
jgi:hypothetical protein